jgi:hypothetical protein
MLRVVLPFTATHVGAIPALYVIDTITAADVRIAVEVVVAVDIDIATAPATTPAPTAAPRSTHGQSDTK